jgi:SAM-dependent methyltransferase
MRTLESLPRPPSLNRIRRLVCDCCGRFAALRRRLRMSVLLRALYSLLPMVSAGRRAAIGTLRRTRLLLPVFRARERMRSVGLRGRLASSEVGPDGLPLPPPHLRVLVAGAVDGNWFIRSGQGEAELIETALRQTGRRIGDFESILDFGCGCGRVIRHWASVESPAIHGADCNEALIRWCREHLAFARFSVNDPTPPLAYADKAFDFVYAVSVFTHLSEELQLSWINDLRRVLRPGGCLLVTTHGERYLGTLDKRERERFLSGSLVVRYDDASGTNLCSAYHPAPYVERTLGRGFHLASFMPGRTSGLMQDTYLLEVPTQRA